MKVKYTKISRSELEKVALQTTNPKEKIAYLKKLLSDTDYQAIKYAEGEMTAEEFAPVKENRAKWREEINRLQ